MRDCEALKLKKKLGFDELSLYSIRGQGDTVAYVQELLNRLNISSLLPTLDFSQ